MPLLFALYIDALAQWIRQTDSRKSIPINGEQHKIALNADYILIYLIEPSNSISVLFNLLDTLGIWFAYEDARYKLNIQITQIMTLNYTPPNKLQKNLTLK